MYGYNNPYYGYQQNMNVQQQNRNSDDRIWVQGEAGARGFMVLPNSVVTLWDSESNTIYIKSANMNGIPQMQVLKYTAAETANNSVDMSNYVTKAYLDERLSAILSAQESKNEQ